MNFDIIQCNTPALQLSCSYIHNEGMLVTKKAMPSLFRWRKPQELFKEVVKLHRLPLKFTRFHSHKSPLIKIAADLNLECAETYGPFTEWYRILRLSSFRASEFQLKMKPQKSLQFLLLWNFAHGMLKVWIKWFKWLEEG